MIFSTPYDWDGVKVMSTMIQNGWLTGWFVVGLCWIYYHRNHVISIPSHLFPHRNDPWHLLQFFSQELWRSILQGLHQMFIEAFLPRSDTGGRHEMRCAVGHCGISFWYSKRSYCSYGSYGPSFPEKFQPKRWYHALSSEPCTPRKSLV